MTRPLRIAMVAGEASGDLLGANLIAALKERLPNAHFMGIGGPKMLAQGLDSWWPQEKLAVMGLVEVLKHIKELSGIRKGLVKRLLTDPPDVFIGIDAPDFNLGLEKQLKAKGVPTVHYVSPSIWAWRPGRIKGIAKAVSHILCLLPFEPALYDAKGIANTYVGHPLADLIPLHVSQSEARFKLDLPPNAPIFALLPGSRTTELNFLADTFIATAKLIAEKLPGAIFLVPLATRETRLQFETALYHAGAQELAFRLLFGHAQDAMAAADTVLVASGTASLECALMKRPMVITYKVARLSAFLWRRMSISPWVGLPNILAHREVVPELLQEKATPENLAEALLTLQQDKDVRAAMVEEFERQHLLLRQNAAERAAGAVLKTLGIVPSPLAAAALATESASHGG